MSDVRGTRRPVGSGCFGTGQTFFSHSSSRVVSCCGFWLGSSGWPRVGVRLSLILQDLL